MSGLLKSQSEKTKPLRVLVVAPSFDILGGQAVQAARLISRLRELPSLEVRFLPINPRLPGALRRLQAIKYLRTVVTSIAYILALLFLVPRFDVIHIFSASYLSFVIAPTPAILIAKLFRRKILLNYHSGEAQDHFARWRSAIPTIRLADAVVVPSGYLVRVFRHSGIPARAIPNLIDLDNFTFRSRDILRPVFLSNRNLEKHYGVDRVLRAFALIQKRFENAELRIAGDGSQLANLQYLANELHLRNTEFVGRVEHAHIAAEYDRADVYLNASEIDNQPLSILEAFACGLPVVTTDAGGIPDMVKEGDTGLVVQCGDTQALASAAIRLLSDARLSTHLAQRAQDECRKYSWEAVGQQWLAAYQELVAAPRAANRLAKFRKLTLAEILTRSAQAFSCFAERWGFSRQSKLISDRGLHGIFRVSGAENLEEIHLHLRSRKVAGFFSSFVNRTETLEQLRKNWPGAEKEIVRVADRIVSGRFDLLGLKDLSFGNPINWHHEPVSGITTPKVHWSRIDFLDPQVAGDKKIIWELNRHQYFVTLGQAYWLTGDETYTETFIAHIESWMDQNPPKVGINWASSLEIAFRSISWLWAIHFFKDSPSLSPKTVANILKFLYLNAHHLETYLSTYFSPNTHLTGEALGLFYIGTVLPEFKESEKWRSLGRKILVEQLAHQVKPDGVYFEQSSYYHRYTADFYTHLLVLSRLNNDALENDIGKKLQALLDHLMYITRPDGTSPLFGDDDGGRLLTLDRQAPNDFRATLSNGAVLFGRGDYKYVADRLAEETLWLLGPNAVQQFSQVPAKKPESLSKAFGDGGYVVMRDGWHEKANYLLFDCGPHGAGNCGHAHADALAVEVASRGVTTLIDPGTHTYTGSSQLRNWFRSSQAHNVLTIDDQPSSAPAGPFSWRTIANAELCSWVSERRFDFVEGRHDGYERLANSVKHSRSILFLKNDYWILRDRVESSGRHQADLRFHFPVDSKAQITSVQGARSAAVEHGKKRGLNLFIFGPEGVWTGEDGWISHCYGERAVAPVCVFSACFKGNDDFVTLLLPASASAREFFSVRKAEAIGGHAVEINSADHSDVVMVRGQNESRIETVRLSSDFNWTWVRFSSKPGMAGEVLELLVIDGSRLQLDGKEILKSTRQIGYLMATRIGDQFRLETEEGVLDLSLPATDLESVFEKMWAVGSGQ